MTTQYVIIDTFDNSGAASITFALKDSTTARASVSVDTITHAFAAGSDNTIIVTLTNATVIPAGDYFLQVTIDGVAGFVWVALAGVADEVVEATAERNVLMQGIADKLTTERLAKIDGAMQAGADGDTGKTLSDQIDLLNVSDSSPGIGFYTIQLEIKLSNGNLVPECDCVLTTSNIDSSTDIHGHVRSNANAIVEFGCDEGTYYLWRQKSGINFNNPRIVTVALHGDVTVTGV